MRRGWGFALSASDGWASEEASADLSAVALATSVGAGAGVDGRGGCCAGDGASTGFFVRGIRGGLGDSLGLGAPLDFEPFASARTFASSSLMLIGAFFDTLSVLGGVPAGFGGVII